MLPTFGTPYCHLREPEQLYLYSYLATGWATERGSIPGRVKRFFLPSANRPYGSEANLPSYPVRTGKPSRPVKYRSVKLNTIKNKWRYGSTNSNAFMPCTQTVLPLFPLTVLGKQEVAWLRNGCSGFVSRRERCFYLRYRVHSSTDISAGKRRESVRKVEMPLISIQY